MYKKNTKTHQEILEITMSIQKDNNKTVLITGGAGYIGSHVQYEFEDNGYQNIIIDDFSSGKKEALSAQSIFYEGQIQDDTLLDKIFSTHEIKGVLHFAASTKVPESVSNPMKYYENNTMASQTLIKSCLKHGISNFIFSSTAAVYGTPKEVQVSEEDQTLPISPYGRSKLFTEYLLKDMSAAHDLTYCILRYFNVAGADPKMRTGQSTENATHLIKVICEALAGKRDHIDIYGCDYPTDDGTCVRDFIHVTDLAKAHYLSFQYLLNQKKNIVLNCGYNHGYSVKQAIAKAEEIGSKKIKAIAAPRREGDIVSLTAKSEKIRKLLDWTPEFDDLTKIISTAYAWEKQLS